MQNTAYVDISTYPKRDHFDNVVVCMQKKKKITVQNTHHKMGRTVTLFCVWWLWQLMGGPATSKTHSLVSIKSCSPAARLRVTWTWHSGNLLSSVHHNRDGSKSLRGRMTESALISVAICRSYRLFAWLSDLVREKSFSTACVSPDPFSVTFHYYYPHPSGIRAKRGANVCLVHYVDCTRLLMVRLTLHKGLCLSLTSPWTPAHFPFKAWFSFTGVHRMILYCWNE